MPEREMKVNRSWETRLKQLCNRSPGIQAYSLGGCDWTQDYFMVNGAQQISYVGEDSN